MGGAGGTRTPDREFVVLPDEFKRLGVGEAVLIAPTAEPRRGSSTYSRRGEGVRSHERSRSPAASPGLARAIEVVKPGLNPGNCTG